MEKFKDIWASMVSHINERTTNPLTFSFIFSWIAWNYRFIMIVISELPIKEKLEFLKTNYPDWNLAWQEGLLFPLLTSLVYVFIYPFITEKVVNFYRHRQVLLANSVKQIEKERILTKEDATALQRRHEKSMIKASESELELQTELNIVREALQAAETELGNLKTFNVELLAINKKNKEKMNANLDKKFSEIDIESDGNNIILKTTVPGLILNNNSLTKRQLQILSILSDGSWVVIDILVSRLQLKRLYIETDLDILGRQNMVGRSTGNRYMLQENGRAALSAFIEQGLWSL
jgi:hypothetical protein